jgi:arsenate reductase
MSLTDSSPLLLHNPACSKSRAAKGWLEQQGIDFTERLYLEQPLTDAELLELRDLLGQPLSACVRTGEGAYGEAALDAQSSDEDHAVAMQRSPILLERPIVVHGGRAAIGRPLSMISDLF